MSGGCGSRGTIGVVIMAASVVVCRMLGIGGSSGTRAQVDGSISRTAVSSKSVMFVQWILVPEFCKLRKIESKYDFVLEVKGTGYLKVFLKIWRENRKKTNINFKIQGRRVKVISY